MATQAAVTGNATKNAGGTVLKAGAISSNSPITNNFTILESVAKTPSYGSKVTLSSGTAYSSGNLGTFNAYSTFAYKQTTGTGRWIMPKVCSFVNGVAIPAAMRGWANGASSSSEKMRSIPYIESARSLGSGVSTSWDAETGAITKGAGAGESRAFINPIGGGTCSDSAARPTNAVPGELTYKTGKKLAVSDDYKPRTSP